MTSKNSLHSPDNLEELFGSVFGRSIASARQPVGFQNLATPSELRSRGWLVFVQETAEDGSAGDPSSWSGWDWVVRAWWA